MAATKRRLRSTSRRNSRVPRRAARGDCLREENCDDCRGPGRVWCDSAAYTTVLRRLVRQYKSIPSTVGSSIASCVATSAAGARLGRLRLSGKPYAAASILGRSICNECSHINDGGSTGGHGIIQLKSIPIMMAVMTLLLLLIYIITSWIDR